MMIHDIKDDPIYQVPDQEPSASSKYKHEGQGFLTHFQTYQRAEIWHTSQESHTMMIHDIKDDPLYVVPDQEPTLSSK